MLAPHDSLDDPQVAAEVVSLLSGPASSGTIGEADANRFLDALTAAHGAEQAQTWAAYFVTQHPGWHGARLRLGRSLVATGDVAGGQAHIDYALASAPGVGALMAGSPGSEVRAAATGIRGFVAAHPRISGGVVLANIAVVAVVVALSSSRPAPSPAAADQSSNPAPVTVAPAASGTGSNLVSGAGGAAPATDPAGGPSGEPSPGVNRP